MNKHIAKVMVYTALTFGGGSMVLFSIFLYVGSFSFLNFGFGPAGILGIDAILCLIFFFQHSTMIRKGFRNHLSKRIPKHYYSAVYAITSGVVLMMMMTFWQQSSVMLFSADGVYRLFFRILFVFSIAGFIWGTRAMAAFDPFGVKSIFFHLKNRELKNLPLIILGPYKMVRHPLYLFSLLMIWSCPDISLDRLMFNILWTCWIIVGTLLEERDLVSDFGEQYQNYQKKIPMLIPFTLFNKRP